MRWAPIDRVRALPRPLRFGLAGGLAAGANWLVRFPLSALMPFLPAVVVAACIGMLVGFLTYRTIVFPGSPRHTSQQVRDFLLVNASTLLVTAIAAVQIRDALLPYMRLTLADATAHAVAIAIGAVLNYFAHNTVTFQGRTPDFASDFDD